VYKGFDLQNLHLNMPDYSHYVYERYLEANYFIPPNVHKYWEHTGTNIVPTPPGTAIQKGLFNIFPVDLVSDELLDTKRSSTSLGKFPPPLSEPFLFLSSLLF